MKENVLFSAHDTFCYVQGGWMIILRSLV